MVGSVISCSCYLCEGRYPLAVCRRCGSLVSGALFEACPQSEALKGFMNAGNQRWVPRLEMTCEACDQNELWVLEAIEKG